MKSTFLLLCGLLLAVISMNAQIKKGAVLLGGQLGFSVGNNKVGGTVTSKNSSVTIAPAFGKAIKDNLVIGVDALYGYNKNDNSQLIKSNTYGLGFFARQYKELGKGFYLFGQARLGGGYSNSRYIDYNTNQPYPNAVKGYNIGIGIYPGIAYSLSKKFQLETGFNNLVYTQFNHNDNFPPFSGNTPTSSNAFSLGTSLSDFSGLTIGFRVFLN